MATVLLSLDRTAEARDMSIEAERLGKTASSHTELTCVIFAVRATVERHSGNTQVARDYAERSLEIATSFFGDSHYRTRDALTSLAHVALDQGEHGEARRLAQRAYEIETKVRRDRGSTALVLGRALWQGDDVSEADQRRARQLVRSAVEDLKDEPAAWRELRAAQSWLGQHDQASAPGGTTAPR